MSLLNPAIITGFALAAIPIVLHLLMRQRPKKLLFPALRLIRARRKNNVRRLRLRHFWLLLLRVAVIVLLVAALTRPSLPAANYEPSLTEWLTAAALVALAAGVYQWLVHRWDRKQMPNHVLAYRRALLRAGVGAGLAALLLLLVAWPYGRRISAEITDPLPNVDRNLPVAAVFVFDTSLSMGYQLNNQTRLEVAQEIATKHLEKLPQGSRVAVADTAAPNPILFQAEQGSAQERVSALRPKAVSLKLNDRIRSAIAMQEDDFRRTQASQDSVPEELRTDRFLREIYLFTDLAATTWRTVDAKALRDELARLPWLQVYLIDVGVEEPVNVGIAGTRLSSQTVPIGGVLSVDLTLESVGMPSADTVVELHMQNENRNMVKREQRTVKMTGSSQTGVTFTVPGITAPISHGEIRLVASDPFHADDVRYFTVAAVEPPDILIVSESASESNLWRQALAPAELMALGKARYRCTEIEASKLAKTDLRPYEIVCLVSVRKPNSETWRALAQFVSGGGGLAVILGHRAIDPVAYNQEPAAELLPATLAGYVQFRPEPAHLDLRDFTHPIFAKFEHFDGGFGPLATVDVNRCWSVEPLDAASVVARYSDDRALPALLERVHGKGRTVMLTTAVDRSGWSDLALAEFRFLALADQMMHHLGGRAENSYNYLAGDEVILHLDPDRPLRRYLLRKPGFEQLPGEVPAGAEVLAIRDADQIGHFEVIAAENEAPYSSGFSANGSSDESRFDRIGTVELDNLLGVGRYSVARNIEGLTRNVQSGRVGEEIYPLVLMVVIAVFCAEHLVSNRFYDTDEAPSAA